MKTIDVEIAGVCPLLQNRFNTEMEGAGKSKQKQKIYIPTEEAEKALYRDKDGFVYEPSEHLLGSLIRAATNFKFEGKKTFKDVVKSCVLVLPDAIPLNDGKTETWDEIDTRPVVIARARVVKWRPKFNDWNLVFQLQILDEDVLDSKTLREILDNAGARYGIGDYRPRFGRFQVTKWNEHNGVSKE